MFDSKQLHAAVVELHAAESAEIKYSTVQNWYAGDKDGKGGILNLVTKRGMCEGKKSKISWTQVETGSAVTWKYPSCILKGDDSIGDFDGLLTQVYEAGAEDEEAEELAEAECHDNRGASKRREVEVPSPAQLRRREPEPDYPSPSELQLPHRYPVWSAGASSARLKSSSSAPALPRVRSARRGEESVLSPMIDGPGHSASQRQAAHWKPVRRKPQQGSHLRPLSHLRRLDTPEDAKKWMPPKVQGGGAWGGILQSQHQRLAGVLAKQHQEMKKMQQQLEVLQQLNRLGSYVGGDARVDGAVHSYMVEMAPKVGRKAPSWKPLSPIRRSALPVLPEDEEQSLLGSRGQSSEAFWEEAAEAERAEELAADARLEVQEVPAEDEGASAEASEQKEFDAEGGPETEAEGVPAAAAEATATGQGSLDSGEIEVSVQVTLPLDEEEEEAACSLQPSVAAQLASEDRDVLAPDEEVGSRTGDAEVEQLQNEDAASSPQQEAANVSFFRGEAQASLLEQAVSSQKQGAIPWAGGSFSTSWMQELEEAAAPYATLCRDTTDVLMANLGSIAPNSRRSSVESQLNTSHYGLPSKQGHCVFSGDRRQEEFLGQIGATEDAPPEKSEPETENTQEPGGDAEHAEEVPQPPPEQTEEAPVELSSDIPAREEISIRGKDWSILAAECDVLLAECRRPLPADSAAEAGGGGVEMATHVPTDRAEVEQEDASETKEDATPAEAVPEDTWAADTVGLELDL
ncbi:ycf24 [Symbiodinium sp. CCMP2592]|nr:ycf24 [Symbiodinium sp. CCMP2592]